MSAPQQWSALAARIAQPLRAVERLRALGPKLALGVATRTRRGVDVDGRPFAPRADGSPSRLNESGAMLSSMRAMSAPGGVAIGFGDPRQAAKAAAHQSGGRGRPARRFFGLDAQQRREVQQQLDNLLGGRR